MQVLYVWLVTAYSLPLSHTPCFDSLVLSRCSRFNRIGPALDRVDMLVAWVVNIAEGLIPKPPPQHSRPTS